MRWTTRPRSEIGGLAAIRAGAGPRVVLFHGVGLRAEAWNASIDLLSAEFETIAPDMPGHGESPPLTEPALLDAYARRALAALDRPALLVGHSMGAMIALDLARRAPERVRGVVAANAIFERAPEAARAVRARAAALAEAGPPDHAATLRRWFGAARSDAATACGQWLAAADRDGYARAYGVFAREDGPSAAALRALAAPALFVTGADDPNSTPAMSEKMARLAPRGRAAAIPEAAHMAPMTHADAFGRLVLAFAREVAA